MAKKDIEKRHKKYIKSYRPTPTHALQNWMEQKHRSIQEKVDRMRSSHLSSEELQKLEQELSSWMSMTKNVAHLLFYIFIDSLRQRLIN